MKVDNYNNFKEFWKHESKYYTNQGVKKKTAYEIWKIAVNSCVNYLKNN